MTAKQLWALDPGPVLCGKGRKKGKIALFVLRSFFFALPRFFWLRACECESAIQDTKSKVGHFLSISFFRASLGYYKCLYFKLTTI
jgi:hypothetical protein